MHYSCLNKVMSRKNNVIADPTATSIGGMESATATFVTTSWHRILRISANVSDSARRERHGGSTGRHNGLGFPATVGASGAQKEQFGKYLQA